MYGDMKDISIYADVLSLLEQLPYVDLHVTWLGDNSA
jgi:hypothetical protein